MSASVSGAAALVVRPARPRTSRTESAPTASTTIGSHSVTRIALTKPSPKTFAASSLICSGVPAGSLLPPAELPMSRLPAAMSWNRDANAPRCAGGSAALSRTAAAESFVDSCAWSSALRGL